MLKARLIRSMILTFALLLLGGLYAQAPDTLWTRTYGGIYTEAGRNMDLTSDGGCIIVGSKVIDESGLQKIWLIKTNAFGDTLWTKMYGGSEISGGYGVQETSDSGFIITGYIGDYANGVGDICLIKTNSNGNQEWLKRYGGNSNEIAKYVTETFDNGFAIAGMTNSYGSGYWDVYLVRTNSKGDTLWTKTYGGSLFDQGNHICETADNGFIVTGQTKSYGAGMQDVWLIKTDVSGNIQWEKLHGGGNDEQAYCVRQTSDGGYIFTAFTRSYGAGSEDFWLVKTDESGSKVWDKTFGGSGWDHPESVYQTLDDGYIITGYTDSYGAGGYDVLVIKTDSEGNEIWNKLIGGSSDERGYAIQQTANGEYVIAGMTESFGNGSSDVWLIKLESEINVGLVAYYPFNGDANDESGNENDGTVNGATLTEDRFGNENSAYYLDGIDDFIDLTNEFDIEEKTIVLWFNLSDQRINYSNVYVSDNPTLQYGFSRLRTSENDELQYASSNCLYSTSIEKNKWYMAAISTADNTTYFYLNDILVNEMPITYYSSEDGHETTYLGTDRRTSFRYFDGFIDDVRIYNRVLNGAEIQILYSENGWDDNNAPAVPIGLYANPDYQQITLRWSQNTEFDLHKYNIYRDTSSPVSTLLDSIVSSLPDTFYVDTDLTNGQTYYYRITAVDSSGNESDFSDEVSAIPGDYIPPNIDITFPTEGFSIPEYELLTTTWNATDNIAMESFVVSYTDKPGAKLCGISILPAESSQCSFYVPAGVTDSAMVWIKGRDTSGNDTLVHSHYFSVTDNTPPEVDLLSMFSDSSFEIMSTRSIFWAASDNVAIQSIGLAYSIDAGNTWISISENEPNDGEYSWLIPDTPSDQCKIKVTATDSVGLSDEAISAGLFTIYVTYPKLISHSTIISPLDTIQLGFSQTLNIEQFSTGLSLSSAIEENLTCDLQFLNNNQNVYIYPENSFISGDTISLILSADQITNAYGYGLDGNQNDAFEGSPMDDDTVTVYVNYSGDFDGNDQVDFDDLTLFANGWYSKDYKYELGPVIGDIPHFITMTDSLFNIEDAMTFGRMWNWFVGIGKHAITMPQLSFGIGFTTEQNGNDLIIHSRASAGKRIVLQYDPEIITINKKQQSLSKPTDLTFEFYADCIDSNRSEYVHYSFNEELSNVPVIFTIKSKQRDPVNITIGIENINETGELILSDVITTRFQPIPDKFEVFPNYPNPFNSQTVIEYAIPVQSDVLINIYDLLGRKVKTLTNNRHEAKYYTLIWDGKDEQGRLAASGLYFLRIVARTESKTFIKTKKMVMIR